MKNYYRLQFLKQLIAERHEAMLSDFRAEQAAELRLQDRQEQAEEREAYNG